MDDERAVKQIYSTEEYVCENKTEEEIAWRKT